MVIRLFRSDLVRVCFGLVTQSTFGQFCIRGTVRMPDSPSIDPSNVSVAFLLLVLLVLLTSLCLLDAKSFESSENATLCFRLILDLCLIGSRMMISL